jgi:hypothetical protein
VGQRPSPATRALIASAIGERAFDRLTASEPMQGERTDLTSGTEYPKSGVRRTKQLRASNRAPAVVQRLDDQDLLAVVQRLDDFVAGVAETRPDSRLFWWRRCRVSSPAHQGPVPPPLFLAPPPFRPDPESRVSDPQQPRPLTSEELAAEYRRILGREPTAQEMEDLQRWYEAWQRE